MKVQWPTFYTLVSPYYSKSNVVCFRYAIAGSAEHPRKARASAFNDSRRSCFNLWAGKP